MKTTASTWITTTTANPAPKAFITKKKQRVKQFDGIVYLKDHDEFEIELFNPRQIHQLVKLKINGNYIIDGGLVLRPGERVFLERHIDTSNKFIYSTYKVDTSNEVNDAIRNNGLVEIEFYNERIYTNIGLPYQFPLTVNTNPYWSTGTTIGTYPHSGGLNSTNSNNSINSVLRSVVERGMEFNPTSFVNSSNKQETGTIEKGSTSNQKFNEVNKDFEMICSYNIVWQILPESRMVHLSNSINKVYCTECGSKIQKSTFKFCPNCGTKM